MFLSKFSDDKNDKFVDNWLQKPTMEAGEPKVTNLGILNYKKLMCPCH